MSMGLITAQILCSLQLYTQMDSDALVGVAVCIHAKLAGFA